MDYETIKYLVCVGFGLLVCLGCSACAVTPDGVVIGSERVHELHYMKLDTRTKLERKE